MSRRLMWGAQALACSLAWTAAGQVAPDRPAPPPGEGERPAAPREGAERGEFRGGGPGGPMTERWLQRLQETSPEEHARLRALRESDPESFHREMRRRFRDELGKKLQREHPAIAQAVQGLPEAEREWMISRMFGGEERGPRGGGMGAGNGPGPGPEMGNASGRHMDEGDAEIWRLGRAYQEAKADPERARLKAQLREKLDQSFTRKHERRRVELDEMDAKVREARTYLLEREKNRAAIIEQRMKELTSEPPAGERPAPPPSTRGGPGFN